MTLRQLPLLFVALAALLFTGCESSRAFHKTTIDGTEYTVTAKPGVEITPELRAEAAQTVAQIAESRKAMVVTMTYDEAVREFEEWQDRYQVVAIEEAEPLFARN